MHTLAPMGSSIGSQTPAHNMMLRSSAHIQGRTRPAACSRKVVSFSRPVLAVKASENGEPQVPATPPPTPAPSPAPEAASTSKPGPLIAAGAVLTAVAAFASSNLLVSGPSLASLENMSVPLEVALSNGKPTVMEFYADWCEVCRELVPFEYEVQKQYSDKVNFVMLNIENTKWAQEAAEYRVGGIPHFIFLDKEGNPLAAAVGRLPPQVLQGNVDALAEGSTQLPYAAVKERTSSLTPPDGARTPRQAAPRDHA